MASSRLRFILPILCLSIGMAEPYRSADVAASDIKLSVVGNSHDLNSYLTTLQGALKQKWVSAWPVNAQGPLQVVMTLHINHSGYLDQADTEGNTIADKPSPADTPHIQKMRGAVVDAVEAVFTGLPPDLPRTVNQSQIVVKAVFVYGTGKPRL